MSASRYRTVLLLAFGLVLSLAGLAADNTATSTVSLALKGRWAGSIDGTFRSQQVSWRFVETENGGIEGFMGPSSAGMPMLPMDNLRMEGNSISFDIADQHASYKGVLDGDMVRGSWSQGPTFSMQMRRKIFSFALDPEVQAQLQGPWQSVDVRSPILLEFSATPDGLLTGELEIPGRGLVDLPMVDLYVDADGLASFATDNGSSFSGRLVNGVLVGEYRTGNRRSQRMTLVHGHRQDVDYVLPLPDQSGDLLLGHWARRERGGIHFEFERNASGELLGWLLVPDDNLRDPILQMHVQDGSFNLLTFSGRSFQGLINAGEMSGQYRVGRASYEFSFVRTDASVPAVP